MSIGQLGRPMTDATLAPVVAVSPRREADHGGPCRDSPIMIVLLVPSVMDRIGIAEPPSDTCSLTA